MGHSGCIVCRRQNRGRLFLRCTEIAAIAGAQNFRIGGAQDPIQAVMVQSPLQSDWGWTLRKVCRKVSASVHDHLHGHCSVRASRQSKLKLSKHVGAGSRANSGYTQASAEPRMDRSAAAINMAQATNRFGRSARSVHEWGHARPATTKQRRGTLLLGWLPSKVQFGSSTQSCLHSALGAQMRQGEHW